MAGATRHCPLGPLGWLRPVLGAAAVLACATPAAVAQTGFMTAIVYDDGGEPLKGATLLAENPGASPRTLTTTSDQRGRISLVGLRSGEWTFTVEHPGFQPSQFNLPIRAGNRNTRPVLIRLQRLPSIVIGGPLAGVDVEQLQQELTAADAALAEDDFDAAIAGYRSALTRAPGLSSINLQLGHALRRKKDDVQAAAVFEALLAVDPASGPAYCELAEVRQAQGRFDEARALYLKAASAEPSWARPVLGLALLATAEGDVEGAVRQLKRVLGIDPQSPEAVRARALLESASR